VFNTHFFEGNLMLNALKICERRNHGHAPANCWPPERWVGASYARERSSWKVRKRSAGTVCRVLLLPFVGALRVSANIAPTRSPTTTSFPKIAALTCPKVERVATKEKE